ncbi:MAG: Sec-independent protein translocase protein TatB [Betaproteobacteria bacterium]
MFDIGFSELMVIGLVALIVIGPERLPRVARTLGHLAGRLQRYVNDVKADINREVELDELRKMRDSVQQAASGFESTVQSELSKTETDLNQAVETAAGDAPKLDAAQVPAPEISTAPIQPAQSIDEKPKVA